MSTDLTIGYIVRDGTYAVVEDRTFVARCSNRQQAERVRAALSAADELAACREWRANVSAAIKGTPEFHSGQWGGDKEGWGYHFEVVNWLIRHRTQLEAALAAASPTTADELARAGWALLSALTEGPAWAERAALEAVLDSYRDATNPGATLQDAFAAAELEIIDAPAHDGRAGSDALGGE